MRRRSGFTLMELMVTVTLIGVLAFIGASTLRTDEIQLTRQGAVDVIQVLRQARYVAARQNLAVVVSVSPYGADRAGGGKTRGLVEARLAATTNCPGVVPAGLPFAEADFGTFTGTDDSDDPGLIAVTPADLTTEAFCVRPNGRIINNATGQPIRPDGEVTAEDIAGKASIWVQFNPIVGGRDVDSDGIFDVPVQQVEIPFNGLVRIPQ